jgi:hypothetical protein
MFKSRKSYLTLQKIVKFSAGHWWFTPVTLTAWEAEIGRTKV